MVAKQLEEMYSQDSHERGRVLVNVTKVQAQDLRTFSGRELAGRVIKAPLCINPFLFIRGLSSPHRVKTSITQNRLNLDFLTIAFLFFVLTLALKMPRSSNGLEIRPQSAFTVFRALLPSVNYSAE